MAGSNGGGRRQVRVSRSGEGVNRMRSVKDERKAHEQALRKNKR